MTNFLKKYWIAFAALFAAAILFLLISSGIESCRTRQFDKTVDTIQTATENTLKEAAKDQKEADNSSIERRTEDAIRERVIKPKLDNVRRRSQTSKVELENLKKRNETKNLHNSNASLDLNCAELKRLYPDAQFEYCYDR
ncbi:MAG: hypothetical protein LUM44_09920 [Pyrinomonadaceae bacterium]|nr:hypothetical protein [Pyrinomonadaceae bacterium]